MLQKLIMSGLLFTSLLFLAWFANEQQKREFIDGDQAYNMELIPLNTEGNNITVDRKVYTKYKSREYVRISTAS